MFRLALNELAALNVAGVSRNYGVDAIPERISRGALPVLLVLPLDVNIGDRPRLFRDSGGGFEALGFSNGTRTVSYQVNHLLLVAPVTSGVGLRQHTPILIDLIDAYFGALGAAVTLDGRLQEPTRVRVEPGTFEYGGVQYVGCIFRHSWVMPV